MCRYSLTFVLVFNTILTNTLTARERSEWFEEFCKQPVVYSSLKYLRLQAKELTHGELSDRERQSKLVHKTETISMLRMILSHLTDEDVVPVLLSMAVMLKDRDDLGGSESSNNPALLFTPHMPWLEAQTAGRAGLVDNFISVVSAVAARVGGIQNLSMMGLKRILHQ